GPRFTLPAVPHLRCKTVHRLPCSRSTGKAAAPMPSRISAWAVYDVFSVRNGEQIFLAVVSDTQWAIFCDAFGLTELKADERIVTNNQRVQARDWLLPQLRKHMEAFTASEISAIFERCGLPYAPITKPQDMFDDPHLLATGGLADVTLPSDASGAGQPVSTKTALLPLTLGGERLQLRAAPPSLGQDTRALLMQLGYTPEDLRQLIEAGIVRCRDQQPGDPASPSANELASA
ncbi:CoA transferase, partial [Paraburkholderia sp. LEh10]|uniref:CoA transferase n=1 Tax=Paraburkholderia sp. LEh10 TaxID=2821353 RepID=UPI001AEAA69D